MTSLNGCHNKQRPVAGAVTHVAQDGWTTKNFGWGPVERTPIWKVIRHVMTTTCQYTLRTPDPRCAGCIHEFKPTDAPAAQENGQT